MRITQDSAAYHSIIWFAVDDNGHIIVANSNEGAIPDFVSEDEEKTEFLAQKLLGIKAVDRNRNPQLSEKNIAEKGFYYFAVSDPYEDSVYRLIAKPGKPVNSDEFDDGIRQILLNQKIGINAETSVSFKI